MLIPEEKLSNVFVICRAATFSKQKEEDYDVVTGTRYALGGGVSFNLCLVALSFFLGHQDYGIGLFSFFF
jgi:hypothetical protein